MQKYKLRRTIGEGRRLRLVVLKALSDGVQVSELSRRYNITQDAIGKFRTRAYENPAKVRALQGYHTVWDESRGAHIFECLCCGARSAHELWMEKHLVRELVPKEYLSVSWPFTEEEIRSNVTQW